MSHKEFNHFTKFHGPQNILNKIWADLRKIFILINYIFQIEHQIQNINHSRQCRDRSLSKFGMNSLHMSYNKRCSLISTKLENYEIYNGR